MALPKLNTPTYELELPSTAEKIKYRPFLVKEQKVLMMAQDSGEDQQIAEAMGNLVSSCTFGKVDAETSPMFDLEYVFLKVRGKSVGETVQLSLICPDDEKTTVPVNLKLDDIEVQMLDNHTNEINISESVKVVFRYPLLSTFTKYASKTNTTDMMFKLIEECVEEVHYHDEVTNRVDMSEKDLSEFIDSLSTEQFAKMGKFFETMPRLRHKIEVKNPKTEVTSEVLLEGIQSFLV